MPREAPLYRETIMVRNDDRGSLCMRCFSISSLVIERYDDLRPYKSMDAVAAAGSKYFISAFSDVKSFCSATTFPFLEDRPAELIEVCRWRDMA